MSATNKATNFYTMYPSHSKVHLINHFKCLQQACLNFQAEANLKVDNFELHIRYQDKTYLLYPQFLVFIDDEPCYTSHFDNNVVCFTGWRPYRPEKINQLPNKLEFKKLLRKESFLVPEYWFNSDEASSPVVVKNCRSSFGKALRGPFHRASDYNAVLKEGEFFEQFLLGTILKIGVWNDEPIYIETQPMTYLIGNGKASIEKLAIKQAKQRDRKPDFQALTDMLAYQGKTLNSVLSLEEAILIDFRYESSFSQLQSVQEISFDDPSATHLGDFFLPLTEYLFTVFQKHHIENLFYTVDGILTDDQKVWILEINSNPTVHQYAYESMLGCLLMN